MTSIIVGIIWLASLVVEWQFIKHNPKIVGAVNKVEAEKLAEVKAAVTPKA